MSHPATAVPAVRRVRIVDAAVGTSRIQGRIATVIRGMIMPEDFDILVVPEYQRVAMKNQKHDDLVLALGPDGTGVPDDLLVCVRTDQYFSQGAGELIIPTIGMNVLDGHQRLTAGQVRRALGQPTDPFGVKIFLGTSKAEEVQTFYQVNRLQTKVSTHVLLRNSGTNAAIEALRELTKTEPGFPQVQWDQLKRHGDIITAHMLYEVAVVLHGYPKGGTIEDLLENLEEITAKIGTELLVENVRTFFQILHKAFGDGQEQYMYRINLMCGLAALFAGFQNFWDTRNTEKLQVRADDVKKLSTLKKRVIEKDLATNSADKAMYQSFRIHLDKGRKTHLQVRVES